jgi:hypothetical protein
LLKRSETGRPRSWRGDCDSFFGLAAGLVLRRLRRTPPLDTLERPALSLPRRIGLLTIGGYILFAIVVVVIKLVQVATAH